MASSGLVCLSIQSVHSHLSLSKGNVEMYALVWSNIFASSCCTYIVGCEAIVSLSRFRFLYNEAKIGGFQLETIKAECLVYRM